MPALLVTGAVGGYLGVLLGALALPVGMYRHEHHIPHGDPSGDPSGKHKDFVYKMRAHANAAEHIPIFIILLGLMEYNECMSTTSLMYLGYGYALLRTMHSVQIRFPKVVPAWVRSIGFVAGVFLVTLMGARLVQECGMKLAEQLNPPAAAATAADFAPAEFAPAPAPQAAAPGLEGFFE